MCCGIMINSFTQIKLQNSATSVLIFKYSSKAIHSTDISTNVAVVPCSIHVYIHKVVVWNICYILGYFVICNFGNVEN